MAKTTVSPSSPVVPTTSTPSTSTNNVDPKPASVAPAVLPQIISAAESTAKVVGEDDEMAKRRARAARFGVPFVEPMKPAEKSTSKATETQAHTNADPGLVRQTMRWFIANVFMYWALFRRPKRLQGLHVLASKMQVQSPTHPIPNLRWILRRRRRKGNEQSVLVSLKLK